MRRACRWTCRNRRRSNARRRKPRATRGFGPAAALLPLALLPALVCAGRSCHCRDTGRFGLLTGGCRQTAPGTPAISAGALARRRFDENGPAALPAGSPAASAAIAPTCRSPPATMARTTSSKARPGWTAGSAHGTRLRPAVAARFDRGLPADNDSAVVCNGCPQGTPGADDHAGIVGSTHSRIDQQGNALPDLPWRWVPPRSERWHPIHARRCAGGDFRTCPSPLKPLLQWRDGIVPVTAD